MHKGYLCTDFIHGRRIKINKSQELIKTLWEPPTLNQFKIHGNLITEPLRSSGWILDCD